MKHNKLIAHAAVLALVSATALTACSSGSAENAGTDDAPSTAAPTAEPTTSSEDPQTEEATTTSEARTETLADEPDADTSIDDLWTLESSFKQPPQSATLLAHDFRVGNHDEYYRVVVEFVGAGEAGWSIQWAEQAYEIARGGPLPIPAGNVLDVMIHGAGAPIAAGSADYYYNGPADKRIDENILAWFDESFEGETHLAISSDKLREYRVFTLEEPKRLVIDLKK